MSSPTPVRRPRADAVRNRAAVVEAARRAFTTDGEDVSLEAVARAAGVGIGTLYRNFPTRQDLVAAVYREELDAVLATVDPLLADHPGAPDRALRAFMTQYAGFIRRKRGLVESLRAGADETAATDVDGSTVADGELRRTAETVGTRVRVNAAIGSFLGAGTETGTFRTDVTADDVTAGMVGVFLTTRDAPEDQVVRLLDVLVRGLRP